MHDHEVSRNLDRELPRAQRQRLTRTLLKEAARTEGIERDNCLDQVVMLNMCVARSIASRYRRRGVPREDLEQVAYAALVRVVHKFDVGRDHDLLSFAVPSIRGELRRYFRDHGWTVRPPRRVQELQTKVIEVREQLSVDGVPSPRRIAEELDVPEDDVREALGAEGCFAPASLDATVGPDGGASIGDQLPDEDSHLAGDAAEARVMLLPALRLLPARDRRLLRMRFVDDLTQQEIAERSGVTQTQVSRLLSRVLADLRQLLEKTELPPPAAAS